MISQFFKDDAGQLSSMRLMSLLTTITACFIAVWYTVTGAGYVAVSVVVSPMLTLAFGGKAVQKRTENGKK